MGPEESIRIQSNLGSTIAMAFDECVENPAEYAYARNSCARTVRWLYRCRDEMRTQNAKEDTINREQMLFGINQGSTYDDLRIECMKRIRELDLDGYAIGGLAVGESADIMYHVIETVEPEMPKDKPRYLMGVGTPANILESVRRGIDLFDCVLPTRNARHGHAFTWEGCRNMHNAKYELDELPLDPACDCPVCRNFSRAYIHHLFKSGEMLAMRLCVMHNIYFFNTLFEEIRRSLDQDSFDAFFNERIDTISRRI